MRVENSKISGARRFWERLALTLFQWESAHTVMIRVLDGGEGWTSGGRSERSRESGDLDRDDARERCGDGMVACMLAVIWMREQECWEYLSCKLLL